MISLHVIENSAAWASPLAKEAQSVGDEAQRINRILDHAEYCGWQEDGKGGGFELWTLRKAIPGHPVGSTIDRGTLEKYLFGNDGKSATR